MLGSAFQLIVLSRFLVAKFFSFSQYAMIIIVKIYFYRSRLRVMLLNDFASYHGAFIQSLYFWCIIPLISIIVRNWCVHFSNMTSPQFKHERKKLRSNSPLILTTIMLPTQIFLIESTENCNYIPILQFSVNSIKKIVLEAWLSSKLVCYSISTFSARV